MSKAYDFQTDIAIIGAGPVGLFSIFQAGMLKMRCHVIDALDFTGGQCTALYPEKPIYDIPGLPRIEAENLIKNLEEQASPFQPHFHLNQRVEGIIRETDNSFTLTTSKSTRINCKAIVIAAGCGAFGPNRPPLDNIESYEGKSVFYLVARKEDFRGKRVVIAGGGDSAVDWAIVLADIAAKTYVIHRRDKFRCAPESASRLQELAASGKIELVIPYQLHSLEGENGILYSVNVSTLEGEVKKLEADYLLPFFGLSMELGPIANWGLGIEKSHIKVDPSTCQTSESGIFAVGDIATYHNKLKLILCGFSEAAMACHAIYPMIHTGQALHFEYSTSKGVPA